MDIKIIEGVEYVPKADIENAFKDRIAKLSARAVQAEEKATAIQTELDNTAGKLGSIDTLQQKINELQNELNTANTRYDRHNAMAQNGFTDPDIRDAVEWAYNKAIQGNDKPPTLQTWLADIKSNPQNAPSILRPHLTTPVTVDPTTQSPGVEPSTPTPTQAIDTPPVMPPKTNTGAQPAPTQQTDLLKRAVNDLEFYRSNRDAIRKAWFNR